MCPLSRLTPLSFLVAMAPRLSPLTRTSTVTIPRQFPLCRIYKFGLNTLPSKTVAIPYTCGLSMTTPSHVMISFRRSPGREHGLCRGIVTANVLEQGLSRGAIAARKLKGVKRDKGHEDYTGSAPYGEDKSLRPVEVVLIRVSMTRELNCYA